MSHRRCFGASRLVSPNRRAECCACCTSSAWTCPPRATQRVSGRLSSTPSISAECNASRYVCTGRQAVASTFRRWGIVFSFTAVVCLPSGYICAEHELQHRSLMSIPRKSSNNPPSPQENRKNVNLLSLAPLPYTYSATCSFRSIDLSTCFPCSNLPSFLFPNFFLSFFFQIPSISVALILSLTQIRGLVYSRLFLPALSSQRTVRAPCIMFHRERSPPSFLPCFPRRLARRCVYTK